MTKADELWEKYSTSASDECDAVFKANFLAALKEYGAAVRAQDVKVCKEEHLIEPTNSADDIAYDNAVRDCAAAIEATPLP